MKTAEYEIEIGTVVRLYVSPVKTRDLGIVKGVHMDTKGQEYFDVAWTGRKDIDRMVPNHLITPAC